MSVAMHSGLNGRFKKTLAHQLDRLDAILDGLADALNGAVSDAVRQAVLQATREAVQVAMAEVLPKPTNAESPKENPLRRLLAQAKAKVKSTFHRVQTWGAKAMQKLRQCTGTTIIAAQSAWVPWRSRVIRMGMLLGSVASCAMGLFRSDSRKIWWGAVIMLSTMLLESYLGTLGTLMLGGSVIYLMKQQREKSIPLVTVPRAA